MAAKTNPVLSFFEFVLSPIIWIMDLLLSGYFLVLGSVGFSVVALAVTMTFICWPLQKYGKVIEDKIRTKITAVDAELSPIKARLKGEALFKETERIYEKHNYHPIQSVALSMSFLVVLPVLISAIILLSSHELMAEQRFLFVSDLSKPDALLPPINVLPVLMTSITVFDAFIRFKDDPKIRTRFLVIAAVLFILVYNLSAALIVYWTTNVTISMFLSLKRGNRVPS